MDDEDDDGDLDLDVSVGVVVLVCAVIGALVYAVVLVFAAWMAGAFV